MPRKPKFAFALLPASSLPKLFEFAAGIAPNVMDEPHVMLNLFSDEIRRNPYPVYDQLRATSPLLQDPQSGLWMIFDYDGVKRVLNDSDAFSSRIGPAEWIIFMDPPRHSKLRALISQGFTPRSITNLEPRIRELTHELLAPQLHRGQMDLADDFSVQLPMIVIAE